MPAETLPPRQSKRAILCPIAKRENSWSWPWPWQPDDTEPLLPTRGVLGGSGEAWELAGRLDEMRWRAEAEEEERVFLTLLAAERKASAP